MGGAGHDFVASSIIRQLCTLGPSRQSLFIPDGSSSVFGGIKTYSRVVIGNLILRRRCWRVERQQLPQVTTTGPDPDFYLVFNNWRRAAKLPLRAFVRLDVDFDPASGNHKPQYMDFSSPFFIRLLASMLQNHKGAIWFQELLPSGESFGAQEQQAHIFEAFADPLLFRNNSELS